MLTRSIGKIVRGKATPLQLALACFLGAMLGFIPGYADGAAFLQSPGLILSLVILLIVLNANLGLAVLVGALAKLASLALMPFSFSVGTFLLEGPAQPLFRSAVNTPFLALFGLEYYATAGGLAVSLAFGLLAAVISIAVINGFRRKMATLEEGSEAYKKYASKRWVKVLAYVFVGKGKGKKTYAELLDKKVGNPIRPIGVVFAVLLAALVFIVWSFFREEIVTAQLRRGLEQANGATVDLRSADLNLRDGRLTVTGLAMADPNNLSTDLFRAQTLEASISGKDLLRKRMTLDTLKASDAVTGEKRQFPGRLIGSRPKPPPPPRQPGDKTLDDYLKEAQAWKERLAQVRRWLDEINQRRGTEAGEPADPQERRETLRERLAREVREKGYARVAAAHLVEGAPTLLVRQAEIAGLRTQPLPGKAEPEVLDVHAQNISTQPWLVKESPRITVKSRSDTLDFDALLGGLASGTAPSRLNLSYRGLPADLIGKQLKVEGTQPLQGGTMDISAQGTLSSGMELDLPLNVIIRDTTMSLPQAGSAPIKELAMPIGVQGPLDDPRILFDGKAFGDALAKAGASELAAKARGEAEKAVNKATEKAVGEATKKLDEKIGGQLKEGLGDLLKKKK